MDEQYEQTALRMIPYGLYALAGQAVTARAQSVAHADGATPSLNELGLKVSCGG